MEVNLSVFKKNEKRLANRVIENITLNDSVHYRKTMILKKKKARAK